MWLKVCFPLLFMLVLSVAVRGDDDDGWETVPSKGRGTTEGPPTNGRWRDTNPGPVHRGPPGGFNGRDHRDNSPGGSGQLRRTQSSPNLRNISDYELQNLSEQLLAVDVNNAASKIAFQTAPNGHQTRIVLTDPNIRNISTYATLEKLLPFYKVDLAEAETDSASKRAAEDAFLTEVMNTEVMKRLMKFLGDGGFITSNPKGQYEWMRTMWFTPYHRGKGRGSPNSCGFEHIFLGETNEELGKVDGLHNWFVMYLEQEKNHLNILDVRDSVVYKDPASGKVKAMVKAVKVTFHGLLKTYSTVSIGLSPELQMAFDTICFFFRTDDKCGLKVADQDYFEQSHSWTVYPSHQQVIASIYPVIENNYTPAAHRSPGGHGGYRGRA